MKNLIFIAMLVSMLGIQCQSHKKVLLTQEPKMVVFTDIEMKPVFSKDFKIEDAHVEDRMLVLKVTFTGGKEKNEFDLFWNKMMMKSLPPKVQLILVQNENHSKGRKQITMTLKYDLSSFVESMSGTSEVVLLINGYEQQIKYKIR